MNREQRMGSALIAFCLAACGCSSQPRFGPNDGVSPVQLPPRQAAAVGDAPPGRPARHRASRSRRANRSTRRNAAAAGGGDADHYVSGKPAARVGAPSTRSILNEEVLAAAYQGLMSARGLPEPERSQRRAEICNQALNQLVEREVVLQDAFGKLEKVNKGTSRSSRRRPPSSSTRRCCGRG